MVDVKYECRSDNRTAITNLSSKRIVLLAPSAEMFNEGTAFGSVRWPVWARHAVNFSYEKCQTSNPNTTQGSNEIEDAVPSMNPTMNMLRIGARCSMA